MNKVNNIMVRVMTVACILMSAVLLLPHHHHHSSDDACIDIMHCLSVHSKTVSHSAHKGACPDAHEDEANKCTGHSHDSSEQDCRMGEVVVFTPERAWDTQKIFSRNLCDFLPILIFKCSNPSVEGLLTFEIRSIIPQPPCLSLMLAFIRQTAPTRAPSTLS